MTVRIFVSYSHKDAEFRRKLDVHFATLKREGVKAFYDGDIEPGADLDVAIKRELRDADIFVALASPEYLHSTYCFEKEYGYALRRAKRKTMYVVVAVIRPCQWKHTRMARYKALPEDGKEVVKWGSRDSAFEDIVNGVRRVVKLAEATPEVPRSKKGKVRKTAKLKPLSVGVPEKKKVASDSNMSQMAPRKTRARQKATAKPAGGSPQVLKSTKRTSSARKPKAY